MTIVARNTATAVVTELHPQSGIDFAFDAVADPGDFWESHSVSRTIRLGAGTWMVAVQRATTAPDVFLRLDDWTFEVDINA